MQRITGSLGVWVWGYSDSQGGTASKCSVLLGALIAANKSYLGQPLVSINLVTFHYKASN